MPNFKEPIFTKLVFAQSNFVQIFSTKFHKINIANSLVSDTRSQTERETDMTTVMVVHFNLTDNL